MLRAQKGARQICRDDTVPLFEGHLFEGHGRHVRAGIVDEEIQPGEFRPDSRKESRDLIRIADIADDRADDIAGQPADFAGRSLEHIRTAAGDDDAVAFSTQSLGDAAADTGPAARDQRDPALARSLPLRHLRPSLRVRLRYGCG